MKTIFITGHDTAIGKTWVTKYIAQRLTELKQKVQVVKVLETGIPKINTYGYTNDILTILQGLDPHYASGATIHSFAAPLAPVSAASLEGKTLKFDEIINKINHLPRPQWRLLEAAGGISVPLDISGKDGRDLAIELNVDYIVVVLVNRLGAINQGRLVLSYLSQAFHNTNNIGLWFNDINIKDPLVTLSNFKELSQSHIPIWGHHSFQQFTPDFCSAPFLNS